VTFNYPSRELPMRIMIKNCFLYLFIPNDKSFRWVLILFIYFLSANLSNAAQSFDWFKINPNLKVSEINTKHLPNGITLNMIEKLLASEYITSEFPITIYPYHDTFIALFSCRLEVLQWIGEQWVNLYEGKSSGFNCKAHFFIRNGKIYSHGRYGFWSGHSETLIFDLEEGSWEVESVKNMPPFFAGSRIHVAGDHIYSINGRYIQQSHGKNELNYNGFYYDFKLKQWSPLTVELFDNHNEYEWTDYSYDLEDFGISDFDYQSYYGWLVFNKKDMSLNFLKTNSTYFEGFQYTYVTKNQFNIVDRKGEHVHLDFEGNLLSKLQNIGKVKIDSSPQINYSSIHYSFLFILSFFVVLGVVWMIKKRKIQTLNIDDFKGQNDSELGGGENEDILFEVKIAIEKLLPHKNQLLEVHKIDEILKLDAIKNMDYRRVKRSRLIKSVNELYLSSNGILFIQRVKSENDRRIVFFQILG
jgi:hypothetical protein